MSASAPGPATEHLVLMHADLAPLQLRVLPATDRKAAGQLWRDLEARIGTGGLACSWIWTSTFLEHYGDVLSHVFVVAERGHEPVGIALLTRGMRWVRGRLPVRWISVGTAGEPREEIYVQYNRLLVTDADRQDFARAISAFARRQRRWDEIHLDGFAEVDARALTEDRDWDIRWERARVMDLDMARAQGDVSSALGKGARYRLRRALRSLEPVRCEWAQDRAHAEDILTELTTLHERRWAAAGHRGVLAGRRASGFHRSLVERLLPAGKVVLFRARGGTGTIGCIYGFVEHGRLIQYQSGFSPSDDNKIRHGLVTHALCMQAALDRGLRAYDLLTGDDRFKLELSNAQEDLMWASTWGPHVRGQVLGRAYRSHRARLARQQEAQTQATASVTSRAGRS